MLTQEPFFYFPGKEEIMKKCLLKFPWVKVPREEIQALKGLLGYWLKLVSRAAFRKGISAYCGYENAVEPGMWVGGIVGV